MKGKLFGLLFLAFIVVMVKLAMTDEESAGACLSAVVILIIIAMMRLR